MKFELTANYIGQTKRFMELMFTIKSVKRRFTTITLFSDWVLTNFTKKNSHEQHNIRFFFSFQSSSNVKFDLFLRILYH